MFYTVLILITVGILLGWWRLRRKMRNTPPGKITLISFHFCEYSSHLALSLSEVARVQTIIDQKKLRNEAPRTLAETILGRDDVIIYNTGSKLSRLLSTAKIVVGMLSFRPDLIIAHENHLPLPALITGLGLLFAPLFLVVHDPATHLGKDSKLTTIQSFSRRSVRRLASQFFVHGQYCKQALSRLIGTDRRITAIAHGAILMPEAAQMHPPRAQDILFFGRLEEYKGLPMLFEVADMLAREIDGFSLTVIGHGSQAGSVADYAHPRPYVHFDGGYATAETVIEAMQSAKIVVLPYDEGTQSGVLCAAFANARPVVATAVGALQEIVNRDNGILTDPGDAGEFAAAIKKLLLNDTEWRRLSDGAASTAATTLSWNAIAGTILDAASESRQ